jgi:hypothetical protein
MRALPLLAAFALGAAAAPFVRSSVRVAEAEARSVAAPGDTVALARLLADVRGARPLYCELVVRSVDGRSWWGSSGSGPGGPLEMDSSAASLLRWVHGGHDDASLVPRLTATLRDDDACLRRIAGSMLGHVRHPSARAALLTALDDENAGTRTAAAIGLGIAEHPAALQPLIARLRDPAPAVRRAAAWALGELENRDAMLPLIDVLGRDADARVRQAAAAAIGKVTS